jgi:hypothetical protein
MSSIETILAEDTPPPTKSEFRFEFTLDAAEHNSRVLQTFNFDFKTAPTAQGPNSTISMGSELWPIQQLDMLLSHHPSYKLFRWNTIHGIDYPIADLPEQQRLTDLETQMDKGNHKSALQPEAIEHVTKAMHSNTSLGYTIPITLDGIRHLKEAVVYPIGLQHQLTINENGAIIPKKRISHNLSNKQDLKRSINQRVDKHQLPSVLYGYALLRFLHLIHNIRCHNPNQPILCNKIDIEKAY